LLNAFLRLTSDIFHHGESAAMSWKPVFQIVKKIPRGRVITYGQLARALKLPGGARTAGRAMAACPQGQGIPWHRVLGAGGRILLREPYAGLQRKLLESEKVRFRGNAVDMTKHAWNPPAALRHHAIRSGKTTHKDKTSR
jgi:methylated-DNA-protein-cysteine methyltransferase-like protein